MKDFKRLNPLFALCGLNCGLCPMHHMKNGCPGCGGGEGHQSCPIVRCSQQHGEPQYCYLCQEFPCGKYQGVSDFDSFISHRNMIHDLNRANQIGIDTYQAELNEKMVLLQELLENFNDGRHKSFFCTAVNLLDLRDSNLAIEQLRTETTPDMPIKEKAALAVRMFQSLGDARGIELKLHKKPKKK